MTDSLSIIIAEDNPRDMDYLCQHLDGHQLIRTVNGQDALQNAVNYDEPNVISDIQMPGMNGIDLAKGLWQERPMARIVFWSQYRDESYVRSLSRMIPPDTVYGFVLKDNSTETVTRAINAVFVDNQCWIDPRVRRVQARLQSPDNSLSDGEYEVLIDIALGLTDNAIAKRRYLSRRGVQNRLRSLYNKLDADHIMPTLQQQSDIVNMRNRAVSIALRRGLLNYPELEKEEQH
ncbi:MAG: response regulator transcription factor, partial [Gammaproteobacteria bacterium]|nr:response regulator transcription factor [Gammaproteobacteria bacterium]